MLMQLFAGSAGPAHDSALDGALQASFDDWSVQDGQISIPRETASRLLQIRAEHAALVFELGKAQTGRLRLCDVLKQGSSLSMWWCSLLYERHPKVTPVLYEVYRLRAAELVMLERGCTALETRGLAGPANQALAAMCRRRGWPFKAHEEADASAGKSRLRKAYEKTPAPLRTLARFGWWLWKVRRHLKGPVTLPPSGQPTGTIATYFPNIDAKLAGEGVFRSRYWESLHDALAEEAGAGKPPAVRWLFVHFPSPQGSLAQCRQWIDGFRRTRQSGVSFNYLEEFLSASDILQGWLRYARLALASLRAQREARGRFRLAGSELDLWPLLGPDFAESFRGWRCLERVLQQKGIENYVAQAGPQRWWTFPLENCPWERMLTHAVHERRAGPVLGAQHSTIRPTDFRYFDDPRTWTDPETLPFQPDRVAGNGESACSQWRAAGVPERRLGQIEALRYLYLAGQEKAKIDGRPRHLLVVTSFFKDETEAHLQLLAEAEDQGLLADFDVTVKPHPYLPVEARLRELLGERAERFAFSTVPVAEALASCPLVWASNSTTVALEAAVKGLPVMVMQPSGDFDLCPLQDVPGLPRTSSLQDLKEALAAAAPLELDPNYLRLDTTLARWREMLGLKQA